MDESTASYFFPFEVKDKIWSKVISEKLNIPLEKFPRLVVGTEIVGNLSKRAA